MGSEAERTGERTAAGVGRASSATRGLGAGLRLAGLGARLLGNEAAGDVVRLGSSLLGASRSAQTLASALGAARLASLGVAGPVGLALAAGLGAGFLASQFLSKPAQAQAGSLSATVSVDARSVASDHRALAALVAREVESGLSTRTRLPSEA